MESEFHQNSGLYKKENNENYNSSYFINHESEKNLNVIQDNN